ncbi:hypothetical protein MTR67_051992, partial [Solanum verrucosum]
STQFTSHFWRSFQKGLGTKVKLSTTFHPQTDGYHSSIDMAPFEALYGRRCTSLIGWFEVEELALLGQELVHGAIEKIRVIKEKLRMALSLQKSYADVRRRDIEFDVHD